MQDGLSKREPLLRPGDREPAVTATADAQAAPSAILPVGVPTVAIASPAKRTNPVVVKTVSSGVANLLIAVNLSGNSLLLVSQGFHGAGSLTTSFQALLLGVCGGTLMAGGVALGKPISEKDFNKASDIANTSYIMTAGLTAVSSTAYAITYFAFPKLFEEATAKAASTYFLTAMLGNWPALALVTTGQIAFQAGDWQSPLYSTMGFRLLSVGLAYALGKTLDMGPAGIGWANTIAPWVSYIPMQLWLRRPQYSNFRRTPFSVEATKQNIRPIAVLGAKMALQRITEWANLSIITSILGSMDNQNLTIIDPSLQFMTLFNLFSQGIGLGGNMILSIDRAAMKKAMKEARDALTVSATPSITQAAEGAIVAVARAETTKEILGRAKEAYGKIKSTTTKSLASGAIINAVLALSLYLARRPIVDLFLPDSATPDMRDAAETALWINGLGLVADALRIISGTLLNAWDKLLFQNIVAIITMTAIGVPAGYLAGRELGEAVIPMFSIRTAMIFLAALINAYQLVTSIKKDASEISAIEGLMIEDGTPAPPSDAVPFYTGGGGAPAASGTDKRGAAHVASAVDNKPSGLKRQ